MRKIGFNSIDKIGEYNRYQGMVYEPISQIEPKEPKAFSLLSGSASTPLATKTNTNTEIVTPKEEEYELNSINSLLKGIKETAVPSKVETTTTTPISESSSDMASFRDLIKVKESGNNYKAHNNRTGYNGTAGSGAWGAYQFIWSKHKDAIKKLLNIERPEDFLNDSEAQDKYFDYWVDTTLVPAMESFKQKYPNNGLTDNQILEGMHFRGPSDFIRQYREGTFDKVNPTEQGNPSIAARLGL